MQEYRKHVLSFLSIKCQHIQSLSQYTKCGPEAEFLIHRKFFEKVEKLKSKPTFYVAHDRYETRSKSKIKIFKQILKLTLSSKYLHQHDVACIIYNPGQFTVSHRNSSSFTIRFSRFNLHLSFLVLFNKKIIYLMKGN